MHINKRLVNMILSKMIAFNDFPKNIHIEYVNGEVILLDGTDRTIDETMISAVMDCGRFVENPDIGHLVIAEWGHVEKYLSPIMRVSGGINEGACICIKKSYLTEYNHLQRCLLGIETIRDNDGDMIFCRQSKEATAMAKSVILKECGYHLPQPTIYTTGKLNDSKSNTGFIYFKSFSHYGKVFFENEDMNGIAKIMMDHISEYIESGFKYDPVVHHVISTMGSGLMSKALCTFEEFLDMETDVVYEPMGLDVPNVIIGD